MNPLVSVVIAVRNGEAYLGRALASIRAQSYSPFEVILVDGHSTDSTLAIARQFNPVNVVTQTGQGIADAYNCGIAASSGELIAFLSHDDEWTPDKLEFQVGFMRENPDLEFTRAFARSVLQPGHSPPEGFRLELLEREHAGAMETFVARARVFERVGLFNTAFATGEDLDWFARAFDLGVASAVIPRVLLTKFVHGANASLTEQTNTASILKLLRSSIRRKQGR